MSEQAVTIDYTNWRGERRLRRIQPVELKFTATRWHTGDPQWILVAIDLEDSNYPERGFAMKDIHSWKVTSE